MAERSIQPRLLRAPRRWTDAQTLAWLHAVSRLHGALTGYGAQRLDPCGWPRLGAGLRLAGATSFRQIALPLAVSWATYADRDSHGQTIVDIASEHREWFTGRRPLLGVLAQSTLDLYAVDEHSERGTWLRRVRDGVIVAVHGTIEAAAFPRGRFLVARIACQPPARVVLVSAMIGAGALRSAFCGSPPQSQAQWSRRLTVAMLRQFAAVALDGFRSTVEPLLTGIPLNEISRRVGEIGGPATCCHPVDIELMRQSGIHQAARSFRSCRSQWSGPEPMPRSLPLLRRRTDGSTTAQHQRRDAGLRDHR